jgi:hypothetical protein
MQAAVGDTITVRAVHQGESDRHGTVIEIHGEDGQPPYVVKWQDDHESLFFPAAGTVVEHHPARTHSKPGVS